HGSMRIRPSPTRRVIVPSERTDTAASRPTDVAVCPLSPFMGGKSDSDAGRAAAPRLSGAPLSGRRCVRGRARYGPAPAAAVPDRRAGHAAGGAETAAGDGAGGA